MKVLLVRLSSAGDILLCHGIIKRLKAAGHRPDMLVKANFADAAKAAGAGTVHLFDGPENEGFLACVKRMSAERYDAVVDLHGTIRSQMLTAMISSANKAYYSKNSLKRRLMAAFKWFISGTVVSVPEAYEKTVMAALPDIRPRTKTAPRPRRKIRNILIHAGAKWPLKRWPYFPELARRLSAIKGINVVITGVKDEVENCQELLYYKKNNVKNMIGKTDFKGLLELIKKSDFFIGNDTAAAHAADMYGVPSVVFLGPTVSGFGFITRDRFHVIEQDGLLCRPCHVHGAGSCLTGGFECMRRTGADKAFQEIKRIINLERRGKWTGKK